MIALLSMANATTLATKRNSDSPISVVHTQRSRWICLAFSSSGLGMPSGSAVVNPTLSDDMLGDVNLHGLAVGILHKWIMLTQGPWLTIALVTSVVPSRHTFKWLHLNTRIPRQWQRWDSGFSGSDCDTRSHA